MSGVEGAIKLNDGTLIPYYIFDGYSSKEAVLQVLSMNGIDTPIYLLYIFNMWYACGFDGWRGFILGKEDIKYISLDGHWIGKKIKQGQMNLELIPTEFQVPTFIEERLWLEFKKTNANPYFFWKVGDQIALYQDTKEMRKTASLFLTQFFPNAWFVAHTLKFTLGEWFSKEIMEEFESAYQFNVWMVNPFTWRIKTGPLSAPYYASFFDFIEQKPKASFAMNGYGKKRNKNTIV